MRQALIEKNAVEIVKQMQRLKGLDDDYDSDSAASNRLQTRSVTIGVRELCCSYSIPEELHTRNEGPNSSQGGS